MSLKTKIALRHPVPLQLLCGLVRDLLGAGPAECERSTYHFGTIQGSGLPAWASVSWGPDFAPVGIVDPDDPFVASAPDDNRAAVVLWFDTAYGYKAANGAGCEDLHAWLIWEICQIAAIHGTVCHWQNEFDGSWHEGPDALRQLGDPERGSLEASNV